MRFSVRFPLHHWLLIVGVLATGSAWGKVPPKKPLPPAVLKFLDWELHANPVSDPSTRGALQFDMEHFEIPLDLVEATWVQSIDPALFDSLVFSKGRRRYLRWIINPEDTRWTSQVEEFLRAQGVPPIRKRLFKAFKTSSRSMVMFNPRNGAVFSAKVSTDKTGGRWQDKRLSANHARKSMRTTQAVAPLHGRGGYSVKFLDEPAIFVLNGMPERDGKEEAKLVDQGMVVRSLHELGRGERLHLPAFSALTSDFGREIAVKNGADPGQTADFWKRHLVEPLARANAEFTAQTGLYYDSPHGQNFLIELDARMSPTGQILLRDFQDSYADGNFWKKTGDPEFAKVWMDKFIRPLTSSTFGPFHGGPSPSFTALPDWLSEAQYKDWVRTYHATFEHRFAELTGVSEKALNEVDTGEIYNLAYHTKNYPAEILGPWYDQAPRLQSPQGPAPLALKSPHELKPAPSVTIGGFVARLSASKAHDGGVRPAELVAVAQLMRAASGEEKRLLLKAFQEMVWAPAEYRIHRLLEHAAPESLGPWVELLHAMDPFYLSNFDPAHFRLFKLPSAERDRMTKVLDEVRPNRELLKDLRSGDLARARSAVRKLRAGRPTSLTLCNAYAFALKRTEDVELRRQLALGLAEASQGETMVKKFIADNPSLIPSLGPEDAHAFAAALHGPAQGCLGVARGVIHKLPH